MKNKIFLIMLSIALSLPITVWAVDNVIDETIEELPIVENTLDEDAISPDEIINSDFKAPISKRKIAKKFLATMGGVAVSSFAIFVMLTVYNRVRERFEKPVITPDGETTLESPENLNDALKIFLDKTKWS